MLRNRKGFTLIELLITLSIIGVLAAIAVPQMGYLVAKSQESTTKGNLGAIRSALSIYYGDNEASYPFDDLRSLALDGKYLPAMPLANYPLSPNSPGHGRLTGVSAGSFPAPINDVGDHVSGWAYDNSGPGVASWGSVVANCTHSDISGTTWSEY